MAQEPGITLRGLMVIVAETDVGRAERAQALAQVLTRLMRERNLTKARLAERSGVSESYIRAILDGHAARGNPTLPSGLTIKQLARGLATNGHTLEVSPDEHRRCTIEMFVALGFLASDWTLELYSPEQSSLIRQFFPSILAALARAAAEGIAESQLGNLVGVTNDLVDGAIAVNKLQGRSAPADQPAASTKPL